MPNIFSRSEHEWLRIAATANPEWDNLRGLAREFTNASWWYLLRRAGEHQLSGVVRWRFLAPELDGVCPEWVREEARQHLDWLERFRDWWQRTGECLAMMDAAGIEWVTSGGPAQYLPLGVLNDAWPRDWNDFDIQVRPEQFRDACRFLENLGFVVSNLCSLRAPSYQKDDVTIEILGTDPDSEYYQDSLYCNLNVIGLRQEANVCGVRVWLPAPEWLFCLMAQRTCSPYIWRGGPVTVWALARLRAWRDTVSDEALAQAIRFADAMTDDSDGLISYGAEIKWTMAIAERVYGCPFPSGLTSAERRPPRVFPTVRPGTVAGDSTPPMRIVVARWNSDEEFLFDSYCRGTGEHLKRGIWREEAE